MNLAAFEDHLDRHGGDLARWPADLRETAAAFLAATPRAAAMHRAMTEVEATLKSMRVASSERGAAVAAVAMRQRQVAPQRGVARAAGWSAAAAVALFLGCMLGGLAPQPSEESVAGVLAASLDPTGAIDVD
jgi:anti-sigma factor RsiW